MPSCSLRSCSRLSTTACTDTSSAAVGSSRMTRSGLSAIARAMPTRAFCPPESWWGKRSRRLERQADLPRQLLAARAHGLAALDVAEPQDRIGDRAHRSEARIEAVGGVLEHHLDALAQRQLGEFLGRDGADVLAVEHDAPSDLSIRRMTMVEVVDLPQPDSPTSPTLSPRCTVKLMPSTARKVVGLGRAAPLRRNSLLKLPARSLRGYSLTSFSTTSSGARLSPLRVRRSVQLGRRAARAAAAAGTAPSARPRAADRARRRPDAASRASACGCRGARRREDGLRLGGLDHAALLHHHDAVAVGRGQAEVVGDEDRRHALLAR